MPQALSMEQRGVGLCVLWPLNLGIPSLCSVLLLQSWQCHHYAVLSAPRTVTRATCERVPTRFKEHDCAVCKSECWVSHSERLYQRLSLKAPFQSPWVTLTAEQYSALVSPRLGWHRRRIKVIKHTNNTPLLACCQHACLAGRSDYNWEESSLAFHGKAGQLESAVRARESPAWWRRRKRYPTWRGEMVCLQLERGAWGFIYSTSNDKREKNGGSRRTKLMTLGRDVLVPSGVAPHLLPLLGFSPVSPWLTHKRRSCPTANTWLLMCFSVLGVWVRQNVKSIMLFPPISSLMQLQKANGQPSRGSKEEKSQWYETSSEWKCSG